MMTERQAIHLRNFINEGGMDGLRNEMKDLLLPDLVSDDWKKRERAYHVYKALSRVEQVIRAAASES